MKVSIIFLIVLILLVLLFDIVKGDIHEPFVTNDKSDQVRIQNLERLNNNMNKEIRSYFQNLS